MNEPAYAGIAGLSVRALKPTGLQAGWLFSQKNLACWVDELQHKEVCLTGCATLEEALADPLFKERGMVVAMKGTNGAPVQMIGVPVKLSKTPGKIKTLPVDFGENTTSLLEDFGYSLSEVDGLHHRDVI